MRTPRPRGRAQGDQAAAEAEIAEIRAQRKKYENEAEFYLKKDAAGRGAARD